MRRDESTDALIARDVIDLDAHLDPGTLVVGVGCDGEVVAARGRTALRASAAGPHVASLREPMRAHFVQPHPDGLLFVHVDGGAVVVGTDGRAGARFHLGDAVEDVRTSRDGTIWVSYSDEGDLTGLARFDARGERTWRYDPATARTDQPVCTYALNAVADDEAWFYFYPEFALVRVRGNATEVWANVVRGARALVVDGEHALLMGEYADRDRVHITAHRLRFRSSYVAERVGSGVVTGANGESLRGARVWGVGRRCFFALGTRVMVVEGW